MSDPKPPKGWEDETPAERKLHEGLYCATRPGDRWCKMRREKRARDRQILVIGGALFVFVVWLDQR